MSNTKLVELTPLEARLIGDAWAQYVRCVHTVAELRGLGGEWTFDWSGHVGFQIVEPPSPTMEDVLRELIPVTESVQ